MYIIDYKYVKKEDCKKQTIPLLSRKKKKKCHFMQKPSSGNEFYQNTMK